MSVGLRGRFFGALVGLERLAGSEGLASPKTSHNLSPGAGSKHLIIVIVHLSFNS